MAEFRFRRHYISSAAAWAFPGSSLDMDFANGRAAINGTQQVPLEALLTCSRASPHLVSSPGGVWQSIENNRLPYFDGCIGMLPEEVRTNIALWCRDFTQASWAAVNTTAALTQTGIDLAANSASLLTATAGNATILQTIVSASTARVLTFFMKRVTGSGAIQICQDGTTFTTVTVTATDSWTRVSLSATQLNPIIGIKIVTNGDAVAVDFGQLEAGTFATSPILTTNAAAARAADLIQPTAFAAGLINASKSAFDKTIGCASAFVGPARIVGWNTGGAYIGFVSTTSIGTNNVTTGANATIGGSGVIANEVSSAFGFDGGNLTAKANGGTPATRAGDWVAATGQISIGNNSSLNRGINGYLKRLAFSPIPSNFDALAI